MKSGTLAFDTPGLLSSDKFPQVARKGNGAYRLMYQAMDPCPNGATGCKICNFPQGRIGFHPRPIERVEVNVTEYVRGAFGGEPNLLPHRFRLTPVTLIYQEQEYPEGQGYHIEGREIIWHDDAPVPDQAVFGFRYSAYREDWVHVQHVSLEAYGGNTQAEKTVLKDFAQVEQGQIGISIHKDAAGYYMSLGDRFLPVDAEMEFTTLLNLKTGDTHCRHRFVTQIIRAYGLDAAGSREIEVPGVTFNPERGRFNIPSGSWPEKLMVIYRAVPIYTVWRDQSEFRAQGTEKQPRVVVLTREEIAK